jgi:hypothetical protein
MDQLGLNKIKHTLFGAELSRGISGGEEKRVGLASELIDGTCGKKFSSNLLIFSS